MKKCIFYTALATLLMLIGPELQAFTFAAQPNVAIQTNGDVVALWTVYDDADGSYIIRATSWSSGGGWTPNITISPVPGISFSPVLSLNDSGNGAAIWTTLDNNGLATLQGSILNLGTWGAPQQFTVPDENEFDYKIAVDALGDIIVTWASYPPNSINSSIYALTGSSVIGGWNVPAGITKISD